MTEEIDFPKAVITKAAPVSTDDQEFPKARITSKRPPFDAGQYYSTPGLLQQIGVTDIDETNPIYQQLLQDDKFIAMSPSERRAAFADAVDEANQALYRAQGEGLPTSQELTEEGATFGTQTRYDAEGNKRTYTIPDPSVRQMDEVFGETGGQVMRSVAGGAVETVRSIGQVIEAGTDAIGLTDPDNDFVQTEFPTIPPESSADQVGQEVTSMLVGTISGTGLAKKLSDLYGLTPKMGKFIAKNWAKLKGKNPAEIADAAKVFANTLIVGTGANLGTTALTPEETAPLLGDNVLEFIGLDAADNKNLANFADNVAFSAAIGTIATAYRGVKSVFGKVFPTKALTENARDADIALMVLSELDANIIGAPAEVIAERAKILGSVLQKNKNITFDELADASVDLDSTTAMRAGAKEYVDRAYAFQRTLMEPDEYIAFADNLAGDMVSKMIDLRRVMMAKGTTIKKATTELLSSSEAALVQTADMLGGTKAVDETAELLTRPLIDMIDEAASKIEPAELGLAQTAADTAQFAERNAVTESLMTATRNNALGADSAEKAFLNKLTGPQMYNAWLSSSTIVNDAFNLLEKVPLDGRRFLEIVRKAASSTDDFKNILVKDQVESDPFKKFLEIISPKTLIKDGEEEVLETTEEIIYRLNGEDFTQIFKELRPLIANRIKVFKANPVTGTEALISLKQGIDQLAEETGNPAFDAAMDLYKQHDNLWGSGASDPLQKYSSVARIANPETGIGMNNAYVAGERAMVESLGSQNNAWVEPFLKAIDSTVSDDTVMPEMAEAYIGMAMNALGRTLAAGDAPSSQAIVNAINPYISSIQKLAPGVVDRWNDAVNTLKSYESGLKTQEQSVLDLNASYAKTMVEAKSAEASRLIYDITGKRVATENPQAAFNSIFNSAEAPTILPELMQAADEAGGLAREGIQSAYMQWLAKKIEVSRAAGLAPGDTTKTVREVSTTQISKILDDPSSPVLKSIATVFSNNMDRAAQIVRLLEIQELALGSRSIKGETFGSSTNYDQQLTKLMDRVVTLRYGVLNTQATITRNLLKTLTASGVQKIQKSADDTFNMIAAYPNEFDRVLQLLAQGKEETALQIMNRYSARGLYLGAGDDVDAQMQSALPEDAAENTAEEITADDGYVEFTPDITTSAKFDPDYRASSMVGRAEEEASIRRFRGDKEGRTGLMSDPNLEPTYPNTGAPITGFESALDTQRGEKELESTR